MPEHHPIEHRLIEEVKSRSVSQTWTYAKSEWVLIGVFWPIKPDTCLCGQSQILEHCVLFNKLNENAVIVCNVCVQKFLGISANNILQGLKRLAATSNCALNAGTINFAHSQGWISSRDRELYRCITRKGTTSLKQWYCLLRVNDKVRSAILLEIEKS